MYDVLIIGGGAAGFFTAINCAEQNPSLRIAILEKGKDVLTKVHISGGGRCNVTNATFVPSELVKNYPRGERELLSPFHRFMSGDVMEWFEDRGVALKIEDDGRVFPKSNSSESIINCFLKEAKTYKISVLTEQNVRNIQLTDKIWQVKTDKSVFSAQKLVIASGSNPKVWKLLADLGHTIIAPVPSLFTFNTTDRFIKDMAGIAVPAEVSLLNSKGKSLKINDSGALLITHWGFSGPAILKLSAWGARQLAELKYQFTLEVNWLGGNLNQEEVITILQETKQNQARKLPQNTSLFNLPKRLWLRLLETSELPLGSAWASLSKVQIRKLAETLVRSRFEIQGKSVFKDEFVTAGGVSLAEINFKTFESKLFKNLYLAGEVLDIDAITGGFNFQNAWTGGYHVAQAITTDSY